MSQLGAPVDKSTTMPVYIITVQEPNKEVFFIKSRKDTCDLYGNYIEVRGCIITEATANKLKKVKDKKEVDRSFGDKEKQIHWFLPWAQVVKIEHITFGGVER